MDEGLFENKNCDSAEHMLTEEEIKKLIDFAPSVQEKALIATLYESGCRIGELIFLKIGHVKFDDHGAQLFVTGKTGLRRVRVVASVPYLIEWLNKHPLKDDSEAFFWTNNRLHLLPIMELHKPFTGSQKRLELRRK